MSAYLVSEIDIDYLLNTAMEIANHGYQTPQYGGIDLDLTTAHDIGRDLWRENVASVADCYRHLDPDQLPGPVPTPDPDTYRYQRLDATTYPFDPICALRQVAHYEYQSCEHPGWEESAARAFCADLRHALIYCLPGYDAAPWGLD